MADERFRNGGGADYAFGIFEICEVLMSVPKKILFFADGTWNGSDKNEDDGADLSENTNVLKMFIRLAGDNADDSILLKNEQEKVLESGNEATQVAKYLHGVGDSDNPIIKLLGGIFGAGIIARIVRGYTYISRNYQPGDSIYIIGFSRGAYTARALAGLVCNQGLLDGHKYDLNDKALAYAMGINAWRAYRQDAANKKPSSAKNVLLQFIHELPGYARLPLNSSDYVAVDGVACVAVWDTVGALGVPVLDANGDPLDVFRFADLDLSAKVAHGLHALSYHEERVNFAPTLWNPRDGVVQKLFPGAHSDVGGGYPLAESGLSDLGLEWMVQQLAALGVAFGPAAKSFKPDPHGMQHTPWTEKPFNAFPHKPRVWPKGVGLQRHPSLPPE
jgi:uncharacterized protein (DUF2235 family)